VNARPDLKVGIVGFGNVGRGVAARLVAGDIPGVTLHAVASRDTEKAAEAAALLSPVLRVLDLHEIVGQVDVVVECTTAAAFPEIARAVIDAGRSMICVSAAGILDFPDMIAEAARTGARIQIATGAFPGFDAIRVAAEGTITSVRHSSHQKPDSLAGEEYVRRQGLHFEEAPPKDPVRVFSGTAREAAEAFPRHFNVAVSLSLAGIGYDRTTVEVWADPSASGAVHTVELESDVSSLSLTIRNKPSDNPRTSKAVVPSILAALRSLVTPLHVGS